MGCGVSRAPPPAALPISSAASQTDNKLGDQDILAIVRNVKYTNGVLSFQGRSREATPETMAKIKAALDLMDLKENPGRWQALNWGQIQESAASTLVMPSTIHQGGTTTCGGSGGV